MLVLRWTRSARHVAPARHELRRVLVGWGLAGLADSAELVLSELFTNAVRHARGPWDRLVETRFERVPGGVRIEVHDAGSDCPTLRSADEGDEAGRGLALVDSMTGHRWGVSSREGVGKLVWALVTSDEAKEPPGIDRSGALL